MCLMFALWEQIYLKSWFWNIWVEFKCFWKKFHLILMPFFKKKKQCALRSFCIKMLCFSKIWFLQTFDRSNLFFDQSKLRLKFLVWVYLTRLMFDRLQLKNFQFLCFLPKKIFMHHLWLWFTCIALFCIYLAVLQSYLLLFS